MNALGWWSIGLSLAAILLSVLSLALGREQQRAPSGPRPGPRRGEAPPPVDHRPRKRSACCDEALDERGWCMNCTNYDYWQSRR